MFVDKNSIGFSGATSGLVYRSNYGHPAQIGGLGSLDSWFSKAKKKVVKAVSEVIKNPSGAIHEAIKDLSATCLPDPIAQSVEDINDSAQQMRQDAKAGLDVAAPILSMIPIPVLQEAAMAYTTAMMVQRAVQAVQAAKQQAQQAKTVAEKAQADANVLTAERELVEAQQAQAQADPATLTKIYWIGGAVLLYLILR